MLGEWQVYNQRENIMQFKIGFWQKEPSLKHIPFDSNFT